MNNTFKIILVIIAIVMIVGLFKQNIWTILLSGSGLCGVGYYAYKNPDTKLFPNKSYKFNEMQGGGLLDTAKKAMTKINLLDPDTLLEKINNNNINLDQLSKIFQHFPSEKKAQFFKKMIENEKYHHIFIKLFEQMENSKEFLSAFDLSGMESDFAKIIQKIDNEKLKEELRGYVYNN